MEEKKATTKKAIEVKSPKKQNPVMYLGPNVPNTMLTTGKIFKSVPVEVKGYIAENPIIGRLLVDVEKISAFNKKAAIKGTEENRIFNEAKKIINEMKGV